CTKDKSFAILDRFVEKGGNFIDTANMYGQGDSPEILGQWLNGNGRKGEQFVIATKVWGQMSDHPNGMGLSRAHIMQAVEDSLRRLQTSYIDLYWIRVQILSVFLFI
ncbi:hypothetical protein CAPTEDRAFT_103858, partial [Capitella teleta]